MDYVALKAEIENDPLNLGYADKSDEDVAALINGAESELVGSAPMTQILLWVAEYGIRANLKTAMASPNKQLADLADNAMSMLSSPHVSQLNVNDPTVSSMLDSLVAAGVISVAARENLNSRVIITKVSRGTAVFGTSVSASDVSQAKAL